MRNVLVILDKRKTVDLIKGVDIQNVRMLRISGWLFRTKEERFILRS